MTSPGPSSTASGHRYPTRRRVILPDEDAEHHPPLADPVDTDAPEPDAEHDRDVEVSESDTSDVDGEDPDKHHAGND